jgi:hypothetical protein
LTLVVLVILAALWAVVLLPPLLRSRTERTTDSIGDFNFRLNVLGRTNGAVGFRATRSGAGPERAAKRRRDVIRVLLIAVGVSGLLALATNSAFVWAVNVLADIALAAFFGLWAWARSVQADRALKVRPIPAHQGERPLRHVASS